MNDDDCMAGMAGHGQFLRFISFLMRHRDDPHMCAVGAMARGGALASLVHSLTHLSHHVEHQRRHGQRGPLGPLIGGLLPTSTQGSYRGTCYVCSALRIGTKSTTEQEREGQTKLHFGHLRW